MANKGKGLTFYETLHEAGQSLIKRKEWQKQD
jgi:hypothetical protein